MKVSKIVINLYTLLFMVVVFCGSEKIGIFGYTAELMALMGVLLLIGSFCSKKEFGFAIDKYAIFLFLVIFLFIVLDYYLWSIYPEYTFVYIKRFLFYTPIMLVCISLDSIEKIIYVSKIYVIFIAIGFVLLYPGQGVNGSFLGSYQNVAGALSVGLMLYAVDFLFKENYTKKDLVAFLFIIGTLLMTGKRTFTVIPIATMLLFSLYKTGNITAKMKMQRLVRIVVPALILGSIVLIVKPDIFLALSRLSDVSQDSNMNGRKNFWELALYLWNENKWTGIGMGTYQEFITRNMHFTFSEFKIQTAYAAHNIYYQLLAEVGLIGISIFVLFFIYNLITIINLIRNNIVKNNSKYIKNAYISLMIQLWFLLYGCTGNPLFMVHQFYLYLFAIMISQSIKRVVRYGKE